MGTLVRNWFTRKHTLRQQSKSLGHAVWIDSLKKRRSNISLLVLVTLSLALSTFGSLTHFILLVSFYTPWKHQSDVLRGYKKRPLAWNGLIYGLYRYFWAFNWQLNIDVKLVSLGTQYKQRYNRINLKNWRFCLTKSRRW